MRLRICALVCGLCFLGAVPGVAGATVIFGAAVFGPVSGAPFTAAGITSLAPIGRTGQLTLVRAVDATSSRLSAAAADHRHFRTLRLAWAVAGGVESACLDDVAVTGYAKRPVAAGMPALERVTLSYAALKRALGPEACRQRPSPPPVAVRLFTDPAGHLHAQADCLLPGCLGTWRVYCATEGCPRSGLGLGALKLGAGAAALARVPLGHDVRGRHPQLTVIVRLVGRKAAIVARAAVDAPPPPLAALTAAAPTTSGNPTPTAGGPPVGDPAPGGGTPGAGGNTPGTSGGSGSGAPGSGSGSGSGTGSGSGAGSGSDPGLGSGSGSGEPLDTTLSLSCDGSAGGAFHAVHGTLGPSLAGQPIELDYVPVDPNADTVIDHVTTGAGGRFSDVPGAPFVETIAYYAGDDDYVSSSAFCPSG